MNISSENIFIKSVLIRKYVDKSFITVEDFVSVEQPLQIEINDIPSTMTMRTPGEDFFLSIGFLFSEGIISNYAEIEEFTQKSDNVVNLLIPSHTENSLKNLNRNFYMTSSCGVCGKTSIESIKYNSQYKPQDYPPLKIEDKILYSLSEQLLSQQSSFAITGGLHGCAIFDQKGNLITYAEDVGRHNALDKLIGKALSNGTIPLRQNILLLSGRASFELTQKASMAGIPVIIAVGAPSSLAVEIADECGITLIGFYKKTGFNIYTHPERIQISNF